MAVSQLRPEPAHLSDSRSTGIDTILKSASFKRPGPELPVEGTTVKGVVWKVRERDLVIDIGRGLKGYLNHSQVSFNGRDARNSAGLKVGDPLTVVIKQVDDLKRSGPRILLGRPENEGNSWATIDQVHPENSRATGHVKELMRPGALVKLSSGTLVFVHNSTLSWTNERLLAKHCLRVGQPVEVVIEKIDKARGFIGASLRAATENPWQTVSDLYPVGRATAGKVTNIKGFGIFVELGNGCTGLLHNDKRPTKAASVKIGEMIRVTVDSIDPERHRIDLGPA